jgi:hypothetical protein
LIPIYDLLEDYEMFRVTTFSVLAALVWGVAVESKAGTYTFTYSDPYGDASHGTVTTSGPDGFGDSGLFVTSGSLTITANPQFLPGGDVSSQFPANHYVGTYNLVPLGPSVTGFYNNLITADNVIYPGNVANSAQPGTAVPGNSYLDAGGLMFGTSQILINIYAVGNSVYGLQIVNTNSQGVPYTDLAVWAPEVGSVSLSAVPEPSSIVQVASGVLMLLVFAWRRGFRPRLVISPPAIR